MVDWETVLQDIDFEEDEEKAVQSCSRLLSDPLAQEVRAMFIEGLCRATNNPVPYADPERFQGEMEAVLTQGVSQSLRSGAISSERLAKLLSQPNLLRILSQVQWLRG